MLASTNIPFDYPELLNVPFSFNDKDCLWALRSFYQKEYGIELTDYARYEGWEYDGMNFMVERYPKMGFRMNDIDGDWSKLQKGDVLLMAIYNNSAQRSDGQANHCAVYLGNNLMFHARFGGHSCVQRIKKSMITHTLRHKDVAIQHKTLETVNYLTTMSEKKQRVLHNAIGKTTSDL